MYKVFINNNPLTFGSQKTKGLKNIPFINLSDFDMAIDLLFRSEDAVHIYSDNVEKVWAKFKNKYKNIHAGGGIVLNSNHEMLWIYRLGKWDLPKGKMEKDENIESTAVREVEEECGISDLHIQKKLKETYHMYFHKEFILKTTHWFLMNYSGNEIAQPQTEEGITDVKWFPMANLEIPTQNTYANILDLMETFLSKN